MSNNLHISYDLYNPGQNYDRVIGRIKELGSCVKIHLSFWYVKSDYTASQAFEYLESALDSNDKVYVVDSSNNAASWNDLPDDVASHVKGHW